jgi:LPS-assembly protein
LTVPPTKFQSTPVRLGRGVLLGLALWAIGVGPWIGRPAFAQAANDDLGRHLVDEKSPSPWHITADEITYDERAQRYVADGNVRISRDDKRLSADHVVFDHRTMDAQARGNVVVVVAKDLLIGEEVDINLDRQTGTAKSGTLFIEKSHFYIQGSHITKLGEDAYTVEDAVLSTCDGERPSWKITSRSLDVTVEGYGLAQHAALWANEVPVFYTPVFIFPAKRERQSGLLTPALGISDRLGPNIVQPLYWAINEQSDATFYAHYMDERGTKIGAEARYLLDRDSFGTAMFDYLDDRREDNGEGSESKDWGYDKDNFLRPNQDRHWFRMKHDQGLWSGARAWLDIDWVSDQDFLPEWRHSMTGYEDSSKAFMDTFGRQLDDYDDPVRTNQAIFNQNGDRYVLNTGVVWLEDATRKRTDGLPNLNSQLQQLPGLRLDFIKQPVGATPLQFTMDSQSAYFYSDDNSRGTRLDLHPRAYWPVRWGDYVYLEPSAGLRETAWFMNHFQDLRRDDFQSDAPSLPDEQRKDKTTDRTIYDLRLDASTEIGKVYDIDGEDISGLHHRMRHRALYEYIPNDIQKKYPAFVFQNDDAEPVPLDDGVNYIRPQNRIVYSMVNTLTSKYRRPVAPDQTTKADQPAFAYNDFLRLEIDQAYDIREARGSDRIEPKGKRPFSPLYTELELSPQDHFQLKYTTEYDYYETRFSSHSLRSSWSTARGDKISLEYNYDNGGYHFYAQDRTDADIESLSGDVRLKLPYRLTAYGSSEYDFSEDRMIESVVGLIYESQCWSLDVNFRQAQNDQAIAFMIKLNGLGGIGF